MFNYRIGNGLYPENSTLYDDFFPNLKIKGTTNDNFNKTTLKKLIV